MYHTGIHLGATRGFRIPNSHFGLYFLLSPFVLPLFSQFPKKFLTEVLLVSSQTFYFLFPNSQTFWPPFPTNIVTPLTTFYQITNKYLSNTRPIEIKRTIKLNTHFINVTSACQLSLTICPCMSIRVQLTRQQCVVCKREANLM